MSAAAATPVGEAKVKVEGEAEGKEAEKESKAAKAEAAKAKKVDEKLLSEFLTEVSQEERKLAIERVLGALKINPLDILRLPTYYTEQQQKKQYRKVSLLVHPDRVKDASMKEAAERAFAKVAQANKDLQDAELATKLKQHIIEARRRVIDKHETDKMLNPRPVKRRRVDGEEGGGSGDETTGADGVKKEEGAEEEEDDGQPRTAGGVKASELVKPIDEEDEYAPEKIEEEVMTELRELLIDDAWNTRIQERMAQKAESQTLREREELKAQIREEKVRQQKWEDSREARVSSWRDWTSTKGKSKGKKKKSKKRKLLGADCPPRPSQLLETLPRPKGL